MMDASHLIGKTLYCKEFGNGTITACRIDGGISCFTVHFDNSNFPDKSYGYPAAFLHDYFVCDDQELNDDIDNEKYKAELPSKMGEQQQIKNSEQLNKTNNQINSILSVVSPNTGTKISLLLEKWQDIDTSKSTEEKEIEKRKAIDYLKNRGVTHLIHFTPIKNLPGILKYGILPKNLIPIDVESVQIDKKRLDRKCDCSCFSITFPNYSILFKRTQKTQEKFAILKINIGVLEEFDYDSIYFIPDNAASNVIRFGNGRYKGEHWAQKLFCKSYSTIQREDLDIPDYYPTNPQAEVMLKGKVDCKYIDRICVNTNLISKDVITAIKSSYKIPISLTPDLFSPRCDYIHWQKV